MSDRPRMNPDRVIANVAFALVIYTIVVVTVAVAVTWGAAQ
jgi:hypothetical protein